MKKLRLKILWLTDMQWQALFQTGSVHQYRVVQGLPEDCHVHHCGYVSDTHRFFLILASKEFPEVESGDALDVLELKIEDIRKYSTIPGGKVA